MLFIKILDGEFEVLQEQKWTVGMRDITPGDCLCSFCLFSDWLGTKIAFLILMSLIMARP